jgi:hypothetical protein
MTLTHIDKRDLDKIETSLQEAIDYISYLRDKYDLN